MRRRTAAPVADAPAADVQGRAHGRAVWSHQVVAWSAIALVLLWARPVAATEREGDAPPPPTLSAAQSPAPAAGSAESSRAQHQHPAPDPGAPADDPHAQHDMGAMSALFPGRTGSGTSWLPTRTVMVGRHFQMGGWSGMLMGSGFAEYLHEVAPIHRGAKQAGSINWLMLMGRRAVGSGWTGVRLMASAEPFSIRGCGYPNLLATGETCDGDSIHDRQHQHDLFMEMAAEYDRPLGKGLRWHVYGGPVGEPALGPVAFPHRQSALVNPLAPISHHWLDATHITFGVVTSGISTSRWRAEASVFNGREPDDRRTDFDFGRLDSVSARFALQASDAVALQVSAGRLNGAETVQGGTTTIDVDRVTASMLYQGRVGGRAAAAALAWGSNAELGTRSHAVLAEATLALTGRHSVFTRAEVTGKAAHDLHIHELPDETILTVGKVQAGYVHLRPARRGLQVGLGATVSAGVVPSSIRPNYGGVGMGFGLFALVRPVMGAP